MSEGESDVAGAKAAMRSAALARRDAIDPSSRASAAAAIAARAGELALPAGAIVGGFMPIRSEVDVRPLLASLARLGHPLALPIVDRPLRFRRWDGNEASLGPAGQGTLGPPPGAEELLPEVLLVPLAAFDRRGYRIGYGRAHYDGTIAHLDALGRRPLTIGVGYAAQQVPEVPVEPHDQPVDRILTERALVIPHEV